MARQLHVEAQAVRNYVTARDGMEYDLLPEGMVAVWISHSNLRMTHADIRLELHSTVADVKQKLYKHCGTPPGHQRLLLKDGDRVVR